MKEIQRKMRHKFTVVWTCEKRDSRGSAEDGGGNGNTWKEASRTTKGNMERNRATGYGSVRSRIRICTRSSKREVDHRKSDPVQGRRWTINE